MPPAQPSAIAPLFPPANTPLDPLTIALARLLADIVADEIIAAERAEQLSDKTCE